jgi:hypothetical protein
MRTATRAPLPTRARTRACLGPPRFVFALRRNTHAVHRNSLEKFIKPTTAKGYRHQLPRITHRGGETQFKGRNLLRLPSVTVVLSNQAQSPPQSAYALFCGKSVKGMVGLFGGREKLPDGRGWRYDGGLTDAQRLGRCVLAGVRGHLEMEIDPGIRNRAGREVRLRTTGTGSVNGLGSVTDPIPGTIPS